MSDISPKERLLDTLQKKNVDRPPVICPGGMMNAAIVDVMRQTGHTLPQGHCDAAVMADLAEDVAKLTGFENIGLPFCMTVEAEVLGSEIDFGTLECEPKIKKERYASVADVEFLNITKLHNAGRVPVVSDAIYSLSKKAKDIPLIGSLTGPVSTAASLVDPMTFLKELRKQNEKSHKLMNYVSEYLISFALRMIDSGATCISIADPTATGEILGPKMFNEFAVRYINKVAGAIHRTGVPVIVHICGKIEAAQQYIPALDADTISTDAPVSLKALKTSFPFLKTMGNLSTYLLESGTPDKISSHTERLIKDNIDIIAPACGLSTSSPLANIQAMTKTVKEYKRG